MNDTPTSMRHADSKCSRHQRCHIEMLHELHIFTPTLRDDDLTAPLNEHIRQAGNHLRQLAREEHEREIYRYYPALIDPDGSPWALGNRYLLSKVTSYIPAKFRTLESIANDLCHFRTWCLAESVDYLVSRGRFRIRPTYRYSFQLHDEIRESKILAGTAKRRIGSVINFYMWLIDEGFKFAEPLWQTSKLSVAYSDKYGLRRFKDVTSTDLARSFSVIKQADDYSDRIVDGGRLRPLSENEQKALISALYDSGNIEMLLSFQFALATGARIQTVFTLRRELFIAEPPPSRSTVRIEIGNGTLVDSKRGKQMVLLVPQTLYRNIRTYLNSERAGNRRVKSQHKYRDENHEYAFLTRNGRAYYLHSSDENISLYRSPVAGNSVRKFIAQSIKPRLSKIDAPFTFSFHDLRATFGLNLLEALATGNECDEGDLSSDAPVFKKLMYVSSRMGHTNVSTTENYLNYGRNRELAQRIQGSYESRLESLI